MILEENTETVREIDTRTRKQTLVKKEEQKNAESHFIPVNKLTSMNVTIILRRNYGQFCEMNTFAIVNTIWYRTRLDKPIL